MIPKVIESAIPVELNSAPDSQTFPLASVMKNLNSSLMISPTGASAATLQRNFCYQLVPASIEIDAIYSM